MKILTGRILFVLMILCGLVAIVTAFTVRITAPTSFETQSSTSVNVSGGIDASQFPDLNQTFNRTMVNVTIMNKSCSTCAYGAHSS